MNKLINISEATKLLADETNANLNTVRQKIYGAIRRNQLDVYGDTKRFLSYQQVEQFKNGTLASKSVYSPFGTIELDSDESIRFLESFHNPNGIGNPLKYKSKSKYGITNKGRVINLTYYRELSQCEAAHGYLQTTIYLNGKKFDERVHVLVGYVWCPNKKLKKEVHHIDGNRKNNYANNLIWVSSKEHAKAHRLLAEAKATNKWNDYRQFIAEIQKDNEWDEEYRCIAFDKEKVVIFIWLPKDTYVDYKTGKKSLKEISTDEVVAERTIRKEPTQ